MKDLSRRRFLQVTALAGAASMLPMPLRWLGTREAFAFSQSPNLSKWTQPLRGLIPIDPNGIPTIPAILAPSPDPVFPDTNFYEIDVNEFTDQLHPDLKPTTLWGYNWKNNPGIQKHLGGVFIGARGTATRFRFTNNLPNKHILPVDTTVPGSNQAVNRIATHLHGGLVPWLSDGGPFDWFGPTGSTGLSFQCGPGSVFDNIATNKMVPGQADFFYPNDQSTRLVWYHDHAHGITRLNAYAGIASGYLIIDPKQEAYLSTGANLNKIVPVDLPHIGQIIPLVIQEKIFNADGSLWYPTQYDPARFRLKSGAGVLPLPNPSCIPEFYGDTQLINGTVSPLVTLEAKRYRFFILNATQARVYNFNLLEVRPDHEIVTDPTTFKPLNQVNLGTVTAADKGLLTGTAPVAGPQIIQIGSEGGYLIKERIFTNNGFYGNYVTAPIANFTGGNLVVAGGERSDIMIDFTGSEGKEFILYNDAPGPFPGGDPLNDYFAGNTLNPASGTFPAAIGQTPDTRQIVRFKILAATPLVADTQPVGPILDATIMDPPALVQYPAAPVVVGSYLKNPIAVPTSVTYGGKIFPVYRRQVTLNEDFDPWGRLRQLLGTNRPARTGGGFGLEYLAPATEVVAAGVVEAWQIFNLTADTHPIHFHLVNVQVLSRQAFKKVGGTFMPTGVARGPQLNELGWKETVQMNPGEVITVIMKFDLPEVPFTVPTSARATVSQSASLTAPGMGLTTGKIYNEYVWHCHILEHEEHDMMRPLIVTGGTGLSVAPKAKSVPSPLVTGTTIPFLVSNGNPTSFKADGTPIYSYTITSSDSVGYPVILTPTGFVTTIPALASPGIVTFTISDGTTTVTAALTVTSAVAARKGSTVKA